MTTSSEQISNYYTNSGGRPDSNLANDALHLGGVPAEDFATLVKVQEYVENLNNTLKQYIDTQDVSYLQQAKAYTDYMISNQDFSSFAKLIDVQAVSDNLTTLINQKNTEQKQYVDGKVAQVVSDTNANFQDINAAVTNLSNSVNSRMNELFQSVSNGKAQIAGAITGKGVSTSANATFSQMATNISNIPQSGGGGGTDTSDATATASDILLGKTAYAKGQKLYGRYVAPNEEEDNPDNPYPSYASGVEKVYEAKQDEVSIKSINSMPNYSIFDISGDGRMMVAYSDNKIKTFVKSSAGYVTKQDGSTQRLLTPEYTLEQLGITLGENESISSIKFAKMNKNTLYSGFSSRVSILVNRGSNAPYLYVFEVKTGDIYINSLLYSCFIYTTNETYQYGDIDNLQSSIRYRKWLIKTGFPSNNFNMFYWSPYSDTVGIGFSGSEWNKIEFYQLDMYRQSSDDEQYGYYINTYTYSVTGFLVKTLRDFKFHNNDRLIEVTRQSNFGYDYYQELHVFDENFNLKGSTRIYTGQSDVNSSIYQIKNDGLYAIKGNKVYSLTVNYVTGTATLSEKGTMDTTFSCNIGQNCFSINDDIFVAAGKIYNINFESAEATLLTQTQYNTSFRILGGLEKFILSVNNTYYLLELIPNQEELIGLRYAGEMYYRHIYPPGTLTAGQPDVRAGKTFIGYLGIPETGTMEVSE